jgi:hypothetical protein
MRKSLTPRKKRYTNHQAYPQLGDSPKQPSRRTVPYIKSAASGNRSSRTRKELRRQLEDLRTQLRDSFLPQSAVASKLLEYLRASFISTVHPGQDWPKVPVPSASSSLSSTFKHWEEKLYRFDNP